MPAAPKRRSLPTRVRGKDMEKGIEILAGPPNPGCTLQIAKFLRERGVKLPSAHPIEILDASIAGRPMP